MYAKVKTIAKKEIFSDPLVLFFQVLGAQTWQKLQKKKRHIYRQGSDAEMTIPQILKIWTYLQMCTRLSASPGHTHMHRCPHTPPLPPPPHTLMHMALRTFLSFWSS